MRLSTGEWRTGGAKTFAVTSGLAILLFARGMIVNPSPPDAVEMRRLADEHNQALRRRLTDSAAPPSGEHAVSIGIAADPGRRGVGLVLDGRF